MKIADETNLINFVDKFKKQGYNDNFTLENGQLKSTTTGEFISTDDFEIEGACQFDITENATDSQYLFMIKTGKTKGLMIDLLGDYLYDDDNLLRKKLNVPIEVHMVEEKVEFKYGLLKVYKADFEKNPDKYELRIGFPDFPTCPFDSSFSMLGYDKEQGSYVWLVTSIIRDARLKRNEYSKA